MENNYIVPHFTNPLPQKVDYDLEEHLIYGKQKGWYLPEFTVYNREMIMEIRKYFYILFIAALIIAVLLIFWKNYNYRKFGKLHRRKFRPPVDDKELSDMFEIDIAMVNKMQNERYILLETNIIPEDLGIGSKNPKEDTYEDEKEEYLKEMKNL